MNPQDTFIARLRRHRERNRIALDEIADETRINKEQLEAFERGDLAAWPEGLYARAWIRSYAIVVGLDPIDTVDEFCRLFPQGDRRAERTLRAFAAILSHHSTYRDEFDLSQPDRRQPLHPAEPAEVASAGESRRDQLTRLVRHMRGVLLQGVERGTRTIRSTNLH